NAFGGYRVQGRGEDGERLLHDAKALQAAGAFSVVLEAVPASLATRVTQSLSIPTIGIGAGPDCDAQVLVWQDMAGLSPRVPKFVKRYADLAGAGRVGHHGQVDADQVAALRALLAPTGWLERTRAFARALRSSARTPGGLLLVGTPGEEPWHLAAHLDEESRFAGLRELAPTL